MNTSEANGISPTLRNACIENRTLLFTLPPEASTYTTLQPTTTPSFISLNTNSVLGGNSQFSFAFMFRIDQYGYPGTQAIYQQQILQMTDGVTQLVVWVVPMSDGVSLVVGAPAATFRMSRNVPCGRWMNLAFTWDGTNATVYLDGVSSTFSLTPPMAFNNPTITFGLNSVAWQPQILPFFGDIDSFYIWNQALSAADIQQQMWAARSTPVRPSQLVVGYDFTTNPPTNLSSGPNASLTNISAQGDATALCSWGSDVARPGAASVLNLGGTAPFSVLAWVFMGNAGFSDTNSTGYLLSNGSLGSASWVGLKVLNGQLIGEVGNSSVSASGSLNQYQWYFVAFTFDGAIGSLYVNGSQVGTGPLSGATPSTASIALFGAIDSTGKPVSCLQGYLQFLSVWTVCLSASEVSDHAYTNPSQDPNCSANFICAESLCSDSKATSGGGVAGTDQIVFGLGVYLGSTFVQTNSQTARLQSEAAPVRNEYVRLSFSDYICPPARLQKPREASKSTRQLLVEEMISLTSAMEDRSLAKTLIDNFCADLDPFFKGGEVTAEIVNGPRIDYKEVDGRYRLFLYSNSSAPLDLGLEIDSPAQCVLWWMSFLNTLLSGVFGIFGVTYPTDKALTLIKEIVTDSAVLSSLTTVAGYRVTAATLLAFYQVLHDFGYLSRAFRLCIGQIGWFGAGRLLLYFVGVVAPAATPQKALFVASSAKLLGQLSQQFLGYPAACAGNGGPLRR